MKKVEAIIRPERLQNVQDALDELGVSGLTVSEQGEFDPVPIELERSRAGYTFRLGVRAGLGGQETARIPIHVRPNEATHPILKEIHWCEVAGKTLEAANPFALKEKVQRALE